MDDGLPPDADAALFAEPPAAGPRAGTPYRVLARKYRPQSFDDLIGQEPMVRTLSNAFETGRIPQAWMLTGVRGVGKTTTARILARALNYVVPGRIERPTVEMPELGLHCAAIIESRHVDVIEMDAASHTGIADIREIIEASRYKPVSARYKVYIIDEVHMLSTSAFNGLLKTLEEPPEHVKFLFATTEIRKVPVTVLSRCQRFDLRRIDADVLVRHLDGICGKEGVTAEPEALAVIARAAEGSVRDSLSLLDQAIAYGDGHIETEAVRAMLGLADRARVVDLFEIVMRGDAGAAIAELAEQHAVGADPAVVLTDLAAFVHLVTRLKLVPAAARDASLTEAERVRGAAFAAGLPLPVLTRAWQILLKGIAEVQAASRPLAAAEMVLVRLAYASDLPTPDEAMRLIKGDGATRSASSAAAGGGSAAASSAVATSRGPAPPTAASQTSPAVATASAGVRASAVAGTTPSATEATASATAPVAASARAAQPRAAATARPQAAVRPDAAPQPSPPEAPPWAEAPRPATAEAGPAIASLADIARIAGDKRDIKLKFGVERQLRPVRFEPGRIEVEPTADAPPGLAGDLGRKLGEWTGTRWVVTVTRGGGGPTLHEAATESAARRRDDALADPLVAAVMARFPGAAIVDVRITAPEDELPPLDDYDVPDIGDPEDGLDEP